MRDPIRSEPMLEGETIFQFAERFGLTFEELMKLNPRKRPPHDRVYFGQHMWVPAGAIDKNKA